MGKFSMEGNIKKWVLVLESHIINAKNVLALHNGGHRLIFPDIARIYDMMKKELLVQK